MKLADRLKMPLVRCMEEHTERHLEVWEAWHEEELSKPDRGDWYLMQVALEVRAFLMILLGQSVKDLKLKDFRLPFGEPVETSREPEGLSKEQVIEASKVVWIGRVGADKVIRKRGEST